MCNAQRDFPFLFVEYDSAWTYGNLKLIPVRYKDEGHGMNSTLYRDFVTLNSAMKNKKFTISEVKTREGADVNVLQVRNRTGKPVIIHTGELISGGKQDRVSGETIIVPHMQENQYLNVYCSEKGRWDKRGKRFAYDGFADASVRRAVDKDRQQQHVWKSISDLYTKHNLSVETWAYKNLKPARKPAIEKDYETYFLGKWRQSDSAYAGFIAVTGNRIITVDLYAHELLTQQFFPNLLGGYIRSAVEEGEVPNISTVEVDNFMTPLLSDAKTRDAFLMKHGRAFRFIDRVIHITAHGN